MSVCQKLGMSLENKVVQKLEINVFNKKSAGLQARIVFPSLKKLDLE